MITRETRALGKAIKRIRRQKKLSQEEVSFTSGVSRGYISQIERGANSPTHDTVIAICKGLEITFLQLAQVFDDILGKRK